MGPPETMRVLVDRWDAGERSAPPELIDPAVELESPFSSVAGPAAPRLRRHRKLGARHRRAVLAVANRPGRVAMHDGRALAYSTICVRGRGSDVELRQDTAAVEFAEDGRIARIRIFVDLDAARDAVGLS